MNQTCVKQSQQVIRDAITIVTKINLLYYLIKILQNKQMPKHIPKNRTEKNF